MLWVLLLLGLLVVVVVALVVLYNRLVTLRSCVKPFGVVALLEAGGIDAFDLEPAEIAIMASSHSGEDLHVRTIQAMFRRAGVGEGTRAITYCGVGISASALLFALVRAGIHDVRLYDASWEEWGRDPTKPIAR